MTDRCAGQVTVRGGKFKRVDWWTNGALHGLESSGKKTGPRGGEAVLETTCCRDNRYWLGQNVAWGVQNANKSRICSVPKTPELIRQKSLVCIRPVSLAYCFPQCKALERPQQQDTSDCFWGKKLTVWIFNIGSFMKFDVVFQSWEVPAGVVSHSASHAHRPLWPHTHTDPCSQHSRLQLQRPMKARPTTEGLQLLYLYFPVTPFKFWCILLNVCSFC